MKKLFIVGLLVVALFLVACAKQGDQSAFAGQATGTNFQKCMKNTDCKTSYTSCNNKCLNDCVSSAATSAGLSATTTKTDCGRNPICKKAYSSCVMKCSDPCFTTAFALMPSSATVDLSGDVNFDGKVNQADADCYGLYVKATDPKKVRCMSSTPLSVSDVNCDGVLNLSDKALVDSYVASGVLSTDGNKNGVSDCKEENSFVCVDSDSSDSTPIGLDTASLNVKGMTKGYNTFTKLYQENIDSCLSSTQVVENYCNSKSTVNADMKDCSLGSTCVDGACVVAKETNCADQVDNDNDGKIDCADVDCAQDGACVKPVVNATNTTKCTPGLTVKNTTCLNSSVLLTSSVNNCDGNVTTKTITCFNETTLKSGLNSTCYTSNLVGSSGCFNCGAPICVKESNGTVNAPLGSELPVNNFDFASDNLNTVCLGYYPYGAWKFTGKFLNGSGCPGSAESKAVQPKSCTPGYTGKYNCTLSSYGYVNAQPFYQNADCSVLVKKDQGGYYPESNWCGNNITNYCTSEKGCCSFKTVSFACDGNVAVNNTVDSCTGLAGPQIKSDCSLIGKNFGLSYSCFAPANDVNGTACYKCGNAVCEKLVTDFQAVAGTRVVSEWGSCSQKNPAGTWKYSGENVTGPGCP